MPDTTPQVSLIITESAARRIATLRQAESNERLMLRLTVAGGGCSGFRYGFGLDEKTNPEDLIFEEHGARVVVDPTSMDLLAGCRVDYVESLRGSYFAVDNPNAASSCGCGSSFSV